MKDPTIDTSFLPDREREEMLARERARLQQEWYDMQEHIKQEPIHIAYSPWEAVGQRRVHTCRKGDSIGKFLADIRQYWPSIKHANPDDLMYIKEGIIIPLHYTFYDFLVNKTQGKSGLLFDADAPASAIGIPDHVIGKVVDRVWYDRNKHIYPASTWDVFDPQKDYSRAGKRNGKEELFDFI
jgi:protein FAM50